MIRAATLADRAAIEVIGRSFMKQYPKMRPDNDRIRELVTSCVSGAAHYAYVSEDEDGVSGCLLAVTGDNLWAQRKNCNILLWAAEIPGDGVAMLRDFRDWVRSRRAIRVAGMCPDVDCDDRVWNVAKRLGFEKSGGAYLLYN